MARISTMVVVALAVAGLSVANGSSSQHRGLIAAPDMPVGEGEDQPVVPGAAAVNLRGVPESSVALSPESRNKDEGPQPSEAAPPVTAPAPPVKAAEDTGALLDRTLLPPLTQGVRVLRSLPTKQQVVNLTFDVEAEPGPAIAILDALKAAGVHASFGLTGTFVRGNPEVVERIIREGHDIFNHTNNHPSLPAIGPLQRRGQLRLMEDALVDVLDRKPVSVFRPPYGQYNPAVLQDIAAMGYRWVLLWNVDPQGFRGYSPAYIASTALEQAKPGSVILLHGIPQDAAAVPSLIRGLKARGLGFVTVSAALGLK